MNRELLIHLCQHSLQTFGALPDATEIIEFYSGIEEERRLDIIDAREGVVLELARGVIIGLSTDDRRLSIFRAATERFNRSTDEP
jgi:hypothetical protein